MNFQECKSGDIASSDLEKTLKEIAAKRNHPELCGKSNFGYCAADTGNFDDTYEQGFEDGRIEFARNLLLKFFGWTPEQIRANIEPLED